MNNRDQEAPIRVRRGPTSVSKLSAGKATMANPKSAGRGNNSGREGRGAGRGARGGRGRGSGYAPKPKSTKVGLCKELEHHIFDYGVSNAADLMRTTQEKIAQYVGAKYGEDISNELTNKTTVVVPPPVYSTVIKLKHRNWEAHVRTRQTRTKAALQAKLTKIQAQDPDMIDDVEVADLENQIEDIEYQQAQEVPYNLTESEKLEFTNESKAHSVRVALLEKHRGNVYALIY